MHLQDASAMQISAVSGCLAQVPRPYARRVHASRRVRARRTRTSHGVARAVGVDRRARCGVEGDDAAATTGASKRKRTDAVLRPRNSQTCGYGELQLLEELQKLRCVMRCVRVLFVSDVPNKTKTITMPHKQRTYTDYSGLIISPLANSSPFTPLIVHPSPSNKSSQAGGASSSS